MWLAITAVVGVSAGLAALAMILRGSTPDQRPALLTATADVLRAWRSPRSSSCPQGQSAHVGLENNRDQRTTKGTVK